MVLNLWCIQHLRDSLSQSQQKQEDTVEGHIRIDYETLRV